MVLSTISALLQLFMPMWLNQQILSLFRWHSFLLAFNLTVLALVAICWHFSQAYFVSQGFTLVFNIPQSNILIPKSLLIPTLITFSCVCLPILFIPGLVSSFKVHILLFHLMPKDTIYLASKKSDTFLEVLLRLSTRLIKK